MARPSLGLNVPSLCVSASLMLDTESTEQTQMRTSSALPDWLARLFSCTSSPCPSSSRSLSFSPLSLSVKHIFLPICSSLSCTCVMHVIWYLIPTDQVKSNQVRGLRATFLVLCEYEGTGSCDGAEGRGVGNLDCAKVSSFFSIWFPRKTERIRTELTGSLPSISSPSTVQDRSVSEGLLVACSTFDFPSALSVPSFLPRSPPRSPPSSSI
jgi:hypothetical protein